MARIGRSNLAKRNVMLKIKNYDKLLRRDIGPWRIGRVERTQTAYLIQLWKNNHDKIQINLERTSVGVPIGLYELWCWNNDTPTAIPIKTMLSITDIKNIDKVLNGIEFLIKNRLW